MISPESWGIQSGFHDTAGVWRPASPESIGAILGAMEADAAGPPTPSILTVRLDRGRPTLPPGQLVLEDGAELVVDGALPADLPPGYHQLIPHEGEPMTVVASPGQVPVPDRAGWGFAVQVYAARSQRSWGMGDLADLRRLAEWSASLGAGLVIVNPLHASGPGYPQQASPYFAGSRSFVNPIYLAVDEASGADRPAEADGLNQDRLIDRDRVWCLKSEALEQAYRRFGRDPGFDAFVVAGGEPLRRFGTYCALAEQHGPRWPEWPTELRTPASHAVGEFAASSVGAERVRYHAWLQWLLDGQLAAARRSLGPVQDLAVGVDPAGADTWIWPGVFAPAMKVGAPPDDFASQGQDWALAAFDPWKLRSAGYQPWIHALRAAFRHGAGLRVDHIMGLFRLYWIPEGASPAEGAYVGYPHEDLLNILALEAHRAGAFVIGEDLGTVEDHVRSELHHRHVLSSRVWWFEPDRPEHWPVHAAGSVSTHDLPTIAGVASGSDPNEASAALRTKLRECTGSDERTPVEEVIRRVYDQLGRAPCLVLAASLEDALAVEERPNLPGTVDEWPNWRLALPVTLEELEGTPLARDVAASLRRDP